MSRNASLATLVGHADGPAPLFLDVTERRKPTNRVASDSGAEGVSDLFVETPSAPKQPAPTSIETMEYDVMPVIQALG